MQCWANHLTGPRRERARRVCVCVCVAAARRMSEGFWQNEVTLFCQVNLCGGGRDKEVCLCVHLCVSAQVGVYV